jgi:hypothetical protein
MKLVTLTSLSTVAVLSFSIPALAQMGSPMPMSSSSSMSSDSSMTCQAMMDKADAMGLPSDLNKRADAKRQMDLAKEAMAKGDEANCKSHMRVAIHNMR